MRSSRNEQPCRVQFEELFRSSWETQSTLLEDPRVSAWLLPFATPVLAFGRWRTAKIATAGLNPSEREFCYRRMKGEEPPGRELEAAERRFLHRTQGDYSSPPASLLAEAQRLAEGYFELGNAYRKWFRGFCPFLKEIGCTFEAGAACHTDYISPFTTKTGIGSVKKNASAVVETLEASGLQSWKNLLNVMPELRLVLGIGRGWSLIPKLFNFDSWNSIRTPFDDKGGRSRVPKPFLLHRSISVGGHGVELFWWRPNRGEPLTWLTNDEKKQLATIVRQHSQ